MASRTPRFQNRARLRLLERLVVSCVLALAALTASHMAVLSARASDPFVSSVEAVPLPGQFASIKLPAVWHSPTVNPYTGIALVPEPSAVRKPRGMQSISMVHETRPAQRTINMPNGDMLIVDYERCVIGYNGREIPFIVDDPNDIGVETAMRQRAQTVASPEAWVLLSYERFDIYIEEGYYNANAAALDDFFNKFEPRYELMENITGWSSEEYYGVKLKIYVESTAGCWGGYALPGEAHLYLYYNLSDQNVCLMSYYENSQQKNNPGELGDQWAYMSGALHESLHSINPLIFYGRLWLTEGFSDYNMYNLLVENNDINQETADYYIQLGTITYNFEDYVGNDYHDTTLNNNELQNSEGYSISAWMFSMLRDDYDLDWNKFYDLVDQNKGIMDKVWNDLWDTSEYFADMPVIDMFGRSVGYDFSQIKEVFEYDGPSGPGWGVRHWMNRDFYPDLRPELSFSIDNPIPGENVNLIATVHNDGDTDVTDFSVCFYLAGNTLIAADTISVAAHDSVVVAVPFSADAGDYAITVILDEEDIKLDLDETNNTANANITFSTCCFDRVGDANGAGGDEPTIGDVSVLIDAKFITGSCDGIVTCFLEADVNQSGGLHPDCDDVTIGDISVLIDYLFITGQPLGMPACL